MALKMDNLMKLHSPTGDDVASLFLLCAPHEALNELDLSVETKDEFITCFDAMRASLREDIIALALYYATYKLIPYYKSKEIIRTLYISPEVIRSLVRLADVEAFIETKGLLTEIEKDKKSRTGKDANKARAGRYMKIHDELKEYYKNNITHTLKPSAAARLLEGTEIYKNSDTQPRRSTLEGYVRDWQAEIIQVTDCAT